MKITLTIGAIILIALYMICTTQKQVAHEQAIGQIYSTPLPSTSK